MPTDEKINPAAKFSVSGYRGIWGSSFTETDAHRLGYAFVALIKSQGGHHILLGQDGRPSGSTVSSILHEVATREGLSVTYAGIAATPTLLFCVREGTFNGGLIVTASHNPSEYNGIKFIAGNGQFITEQELEELKSYLPDEVEEIPSTSLPEASLTCTEDHIERIASTVDCKNIQASELSVVLDPVNSAGKAGAHLLFEKLGVSAHTIHSDVTHSFERPPEPIPENLDALAQAVRTNQADVGFAQDPDADRLVLVNEKGDILSEEYTLALAVEQVLSRTPGGTVVVNMSTSSIIDTIAARYGASVHRTKIGEMHVSAGILKHAAAIGGEGNGGVIYPTCNLARDSFVGMALILSLLAERNQSLSEICSAVIPKMVMQKEKYTFSGSLENVYEDIRTSISHTKESTLDGLRIDSSDGAWVHIRPSNTEPVVRIIAESSSEKQTKNLISTTKSILEKHME